MTVTTIDGNHLIARQATIFLIKILKSICTTHITYYVHSLLIFQNQIFKFSFSDVIYFKKKKIFLFLCGFSFTGVFFYFWFSLKV